MIRFTSCYLVLVAISAASFVDASEIVPGIPNPWESDINAEIQPGDLPGTIWDVVWETYGDEVLNELSEYPGISMLEESLESLSAELDALWEDHPVLSVSVGIAIITAFPGIEDAIEDIADDVLGIDEAELSVSSFPLPPFTVGSPLPGDATVHSSISLGEDSNVNGGAILIEQSY